MSNRTKEEIAKDIKFVLEDKVAPAVAQHNGFINYLDFDMELGVAKLELAGSCSGCAMSKQTLHQGVEDMLKHYVPEVNAIVGEDDEKAVEQGYSPFVPSNQYPEEETESERLQKQLEPIDAIDNLTGTEQLDRIDSLTTENQENKK
jgi:Fe-S cluster biogenesis protein NfuA